MLIELAKLAKIHKFGLANSLLHSPMATWLTLTGTLRPVVGFFLKVNGFGIKSTILTYHIY